MIRIGLTGSIASGKSSVTEILREMGIAVFDADEVVHGLYGNAKLAAEIERLLPGSTVAGVVNREAVMRIIQAAPEKLKTLESFVHPLVQREELSFAKERRKRGDKLVVFDIPLLMETGRGDDYDAVVLVSADESTRKTRAMQRHGMSSGKWETVNARQLTDSQKRLQADYIVENNGSLDNLRLSVEDLLAALAAPRKNRNA